MLTSKTFVVGIIIYFVKQTFLKIYCYSILHPTRVLMYINFYSLHLIYTKLTVSRLILLFFSEQLYLNIH